MNFKRHIVFILFFTIIHFSYGQYFNTRYPVSNGWGGNGISVAENNSGYISIGGYIPFSTGLSTIQVLQTDFNGNVLYRKTYGDTSHAYFVGMRGSLVQLPSGGLTYGGRAKAGGTSNSNVGLLYRFNAVGDTLWTKTYGDTLAFQTGRNIKQTADGGFILLGQNAKNNAAGDYWLVKTDSMGNVEWEKVWGGFFEDAPASIDLCTDGGYIITGGTKNSGPGTPGLANIEIIKTDSLGNIEFSKIFGGIFEDAAWSIAQTQDGGYIFGGGLTIADPCGGGCEESYPYAIKLDSIGDTLWTRTYGKSEDQTTFRTVRELSDGSFIGVGQVNQSDMVTFNRLEGLLVRFAANGDSLFYTTHRKLNGIISKQDIQDIQPTSDGGFICTGVVFPRPPDTGTQDLWLMKLDSNGCVNTNCTVSINKNELNAGNFVVYPNPSNGIFTVKNTHLTPGNLTIKVYNILGVLLLEQYLSDVKIDLTDLSNGVYFLKIVNALGHHIHTEKLILRK